MSQQYSADEFFTQGRGRVTLCGSTKFFEQCMEANRELTFKGWIVLMCGSWGHSYHCGREGAGTNYELVKRLHFLKLVDSHAVVVVSDKSAYIGQSTIAEIAFAEACAMPIFYYNSKEFSGSTSKRPTDELSHHADLIFAYEQLGNDLGI